MPMHFTLQTAENGQRFIAVFVNGSLMQADDSHPNFTAIVGACQASLAGEDVDSDGVADLFDIAATVERKFARLSERVTVENGVVLFDGDPAQEGLSKQILRFMDEGEDFEPLVNFMEKIEANPVPHSKQQAWDWLNQHDFSVTPEGDVIGYKGVYDDGQGGYRSGHRGNAFVNDVPVVNDYVPNAVGDVVSMRRSEVAHDPAQACHSGLHIGTFDYAKSYAQGAMLKVIVDPRDIVSVPTQDVGQKIRVCRYKVAEIIDAPVAKALDWSGFEDDDSSDLDLEFSDDSPLAVGDRVQDYDGDEGTVTGVDDEGVATVKYDDPEWGTVDYTEDEQRRELVRTSHGKGGPTSQAAKGRGKNPAQDATGRFVNGRPGSQRDPKTGRFAG